jgi:sulfite reductase alpha subunit-like flavoprotein
MFWQGSGIEYRPGDTIGVIPQNSKDEVQKIMKHLKILERADTVVTVSVKPGTVKKKACVPSYIPMKATLRHILQTCLDIRAVPKKVTALCMSQILHIIYCQTYSLCIDKNQMSLP